MNLTDVDSSDNSSSTTRTQEERTTVFSSIMMMEEDDSVDRHQTTDTTVSAADDNNININSTVRNNNEDDDGPIVGAVMTKEVQQERRNSIREIMADESLTSLEKRKTIQSLMDGRSRRRSSTGGSSCASTTSSTVGSNSNPYEYNYYPHPPSDQQQDFIDPYYYRNQNLVYNNSGTMSHSQLNQSEENEYYAYQDYHDAQNIQQPPYQKSANNLDLTNEELMESMVISSDTSSSPTSLSGRKPRSSSMPLWSEDTSRAAAPLVAASSNSIWDDPINVNRRMEKSRPPCEHYERNCTIISPCCGLAFGCRICHDECPVLPMPIYSKQSSSALLTTNNTSTGTAAKTTQAAINTGTVVSKEGTNKTILGVSSPTGQPERLLNWDAVEKAKFHKVEKRRSMPLSYEEYYAETEEETHHEIDRFAIAEIICRLCYTRQSSKTNFCSACGAQFGAYHCNICNLWMSDEESPYHCADCGFCRVGGKENFRHCEDCGMCIDTLLFDDHNCKAGKYMSNCPVCQEDLFSSRDASHEMPCGHAIHWHCFKELTSYDTRCPVCKKTAETPEHMASTWQAMAMGIALQPVPPELARVVTIRCNDCEELDEDRRWHFLGVRCMHCLSFNTTVERTTLTGQEAAQYLDELEQIYGGGKNAMEGPRPMDAS